MQAGGIEGGMMETKFGWLRLEQARLLLLTHTGQGVHPRTHLDRKHAQPLGQRAPHAPRLAGHSLLLLGGQRKAAAAAEGEGRRGQARGSRP